jgi:ElaB/YqjD/DUF883 family membrane-anchored ribosome-binding protein
MQSSLYPKETAAAAKDLAAAAKSDIANVAQSAAQTVRDFAGESCATAAKRFNTTSKWITTTAKENPLRTLGVAVAAGAIVAFLLGRRSS